MTIRLYPSTERGPGSISTIWSPDLDVGEIAAVLNAALDTETAAYLAVLMAAGANLLQHLAEDVGIEPTELARQLETDGTGRLDVCMASANEKLSSYELQIVVTREDGETYPLATLHGAYHSFAEAWARWLVRQTAVLFTPQIVEARVVGPYDRVEAIFARRDGKQAEGTEDAA